MSVVGTLTAFNTMNMRARAALGTLALAILTAVAEILWNQYIINAIKVQH